MKITGKRQSHAFAEIVKTCLRVIISLITLGLQFAFYYFLFFTVRNLWYVQLASLVLAGIFVIYIYQKKVNSSYKLSWTIFLLLFPFFGVVLYLLFGSGYAIPRRKAQKVFEKYKGNIPQNDVHTKLQSEDARGGMIAENLRLSTRLPLYQNTQIKYFSSAKLKHESLLEDLRQAKEYVYIEYFIISDGYVLESVLEILEQKGKEGVKIKFLYDDIGSKKALKRKTKKRIAKIKNLELCVFEPLGVIINPRINYRDHRKIVVIDGKIGYVGGDNLADEYVGRLIKYGKWRDNAIRLYGDAVYSLELLFAETWYLSCKERISLKTFVPSEKVESDGYVMPYGDGPTNVKASSYHLFESMFSSAQKYLYISTPYFIIDSAFVDQICQSARCGVDVRLIVPHIPDKKLVFAMTRGHYGELIKAGVKVYEYLPGFNHAKNVIVDDKYAFIGTVNCDYRSLMLHFENGVYLANNSTIPSMKEDFIKATQESKLISYDEWKSRSFFTKVTELILSFIAPLL